MMKRMKVWKMTNNNFRVKGGGRANARRTRRAFRMKRRNVGKVLAMVAGLVALHSSEEFAKAEPAKMVEPAEPAEAVKVSDALAEVLAKRSWQKADRDVVCSEATRLGLTAAEFAEKFGVSERRVKNAGV